MINKRTTIAFAKAWLDEANDNKFLFFTNAKTLPVIIRHSQGLIKP